MDNNTDFLRKERQERVMRAIRNEKNDRTPLMMPGDCALLRYSKPDATFKWMVEHPVEMNRIIADQTLALLPKVDFMGGSCGKSPRFLGAIWLGKTLLPGKELPENEMWQPVLGGTIRDGDYELIADKGWSWFRDMCLYERLQLPKDEMAEDRAISMGNTENLYDHGYPFVKGSPTPAAFDFLCLGRGPMDFLVDLITDPDPVHAAIDTILEEYLATGDSLKKQVAAAAEKGEVTMINVNPCVYANCDMVSRAVFEEFGWPLIKKISDHVLASGANIFFHMDTNWTDFLDYFSEFPAGRCIFDSDGGTDLIKLRDMHGNRFAITGNISPTLLAFGTPDDVYKECRRQIEEMGDSFILAPACSLPANTPKANIDAMYAAV